MITIDILVAQISGLNRPDLDRWIVNKWVRPEKRSGTVLFQEIDVARVRLILELRENMDISEDALPLILSLLDQLYDLRRRFLALGDAISEAAPEDLQRDIARRLAKRTLGERHSSDLHHAPRHADKP